MSELENFRNLGISEITLEALRRKGFEEPSPIQSLTIPLLLEGLHDVIGQAQTGTGKTAAFGIPILERCERGDGMPSALILSPTRELSIQIAEEINSLKGARDLRVAPFYGGQSIEIQLQRLRDGVDIAIGTPGRVIDLMERGRLKLDNIRFAVLDEADEMLDMGFIEDIEKILGAAPENKRMLMFSATMPPAIESIAERFMHEPEIVRTKRDDSAAERTEQIYFEVRRESKLEALSRIIDMEEDIYAMVFCRTRNDVDELTEKLNARGYGVESLHGDIAQAQRTKVINRFKEKKFRLLIATDVAARGIDVNDLTHVINYSIPQGTETYIHRIGRTGRAGKSGVAITFVTPSEFRRMSQIKREIKSDIRREDLPTGDDVIAARKQRFADRISQLVADGGHQEYLNFAEELLTLTDSPADVIGAMLRMKFKGELLPGSYEDLNGRRREKSSPDDRGKTRLFIGVGKGDGFGTTQLLDLIYEMTRIKSYRLGKVECYDHFSFVNATFEDGERIIESFRRRRGPSVQIARPDERNDRGEREEREERHERRERRERRERGEREEREERRERPARPARPERRQRYEERGAERPPRPAKLMDQPPQEAPQPVEEKKPRRKLRSEFQFDDEPVKPKKVKKNARKKD